jgi:hypothetical protein
VARSSAKRSGLWSYAYNYLSTCPFATPPFRTSKAPFADDLVSPGMVFRSIGFHADLPFPRAWPKTRMDGSASCNSFCGARAEPHALQAKITTASSGTLSYTAASSIPSPPFVGIFIILKEGMATARSSPDKMRPTSSDLRPPTLMPKEHNCSFSSGIVILSNSSREVPLLTIENVRAHVHQPGWTNTWDWDVE